MADDGRDGAHRLRIDGKSGLWRGLSYLAVSASIFYAMATGDRGGWQAIIAPVLAGELLLAWGCISLATKPTGHATEEEAEAARRLLRALYGLFSIALLIVLLVQGSPSGLLYVLALYTNFRVATAGAERERSASLARAIVATLVLVIVGVPLLVAIRDEGRAFMLIGALYFLLLPLAEALWLRWATEVASRQQR